MAGHDERLGDFACFLVGAWDHGRVRDVRVGEQDGFEVGGSHLMALVLDQLLQPVDDVPEAIFVDVGDVAGVEPVGGVHGRGGGLGSVEVALSHVRAAEPEFAPLAHAKLPPGFRVDDQRFHVRRKEADRSVATFLLIERMEVGRARHFGHAVALDHPAVKPVGHGHFHVSAQRGCARHDPLKLGEIVVRDRWVFGKGHDDRRDQRRHDHLVLGKRRQERLDLEPGDHHQRRATPECRQQDQHQAVDMEEWEYRDQRSLEPGLN